MKKTFLKKCLGFAMGTTGCFYFFMTLSLVCHEVLGHGLVAILCGGRFQSFSVSPGFSGLASVPEVPGDFQWIVTYGGILLNAAVGLSAWLAAFFATKLTALNFAIFWIAATQSGHALGYVGEFTQHARDFRSVWNDLSIKGVGARAI